MWAIVPPYSVTVKKKRSSIRVSIRKSIIYKHYEFSKIFGRHSLKTSETTALELIRLRRSEDKKLGVKYNICTDMHIIFYKLEFEYEMSIDRASSYILLYQQ